MMTPAWNRRREAARKYRPKRIKLLLVAESPPEDESRYVYFEAADSADPLFEEVCQVLFDSESTPEKTTGLKELRRRGVFVVELKPDAARKDESLVPYVPPFLINLDTLAPEKIVLIGDDAYRAAFPLMEKADVPVVDVRVPLPTPEHEADFHRTLRQALVRADLEKLIRPLPGGARPPA